MFKLPTRAQLAPNIKSWITVSLISIPLSISLAVASGATPLQGILTAIWACMIAGFIGGSNYNIFWPAGALTALLMAFYSSTQDVYTLPLLALSVALRSAIIRKLKLTKYITLIPATALHGFIAGVSLIIASGQINNALWLVWLTKHSHTLANIIESVTHLAQTNITSLIIFIVWLWFLLIWKRTIKSIPWPIPVAIIGIWLWRAITHWYIDWNTRLLVDQFPDLTFRLIDLWWIDSLKTHLLSWWFIQSLLTSGFIISVISILETLISAKIADRLTHTKYDQSKEVRAIVWANLISGLAWGLPTTAVLIRTALNIKSGATSWISAVITGVSVLIISWLGFEYFTLIPMALIAAILVNIAIWLLDFHHYRHIYHFDHQDAVILAIVALVTFLTDPVYGILAWVSLSLLAYIKRNTELTPYVTIFREWVFYKKTTLQKYLCHQQTHDIIIIKFIGEISFLNIATIQDGLFQLIHHPYVVISMSGVNRIDLDGIDALQELFDHLDTQSIEYHITWLSKFLKQQLSHSWRYHRACEQSRIHYSTAWVMESLLKRNSE